MENPKKILSRAKELYPELIEIRRHLHQNPELSFKEYNTSKFIQARLASLDIPFKIAAGTGVVGIIGKGKNCIALRSDMDALPIQEDTGLEFSSKNMGIMHACGHDMHIAMMLGAATILKGLENKIDFTIKLIFQPGEEKLPGGALKMIEEGVLSNPTPKAVFAQHINPEIEVGKISTSPGPIMASADELYWHITGKGTHAAQPHLGGDPLLAASHINIFLQSLINKVRNPVIPALISVTAIHGGSAPNIIPDNVRLMGTMRTFNTILRNRLHKEITSGSKNISSMFNTICTLKIEKGYPPLINNIKTTEYVKNAGSLLLGKDSVLEFEPKMWAEDFAYYAEKVPSTFWFLGVKPEGAPELPPLHNSKLVPDEEALIYGTAMMAAVAYNYFNLNQ